jgi:hypothetical protein
MGHVVIVKPGNELRGTMRAGAVILLCVLCAGTVAADVTLSVVPVAKALQNPELHGESPDAARAAVSELLLNQPADEAETGRFHARLADLARHKDTRLGRLFFRMLETTPDVEQVPEGAKAVELLVRRPLALDAVSRVLVEWRLDGETWKIARLDVFLEGIAAAPVVKAAPYFAHGPVMSDRFDAQELDYLVGRDPTQRNRPDAEPFDFAAALENYLKSEAGAYTALVKQLRQDVSPGKERALRIAALKPHLTKGGQQEVESADADPERRGEFWATIFKQLEAAESAPQPAAVPVRRQSELRITVKDGAGKAVAATYVQRLATGKIAPRIKATEAGNGRKGD